LKIIFEAFKEAQKLPRKILEIAAQARPRTRPRRGQDAAQVRPGRGPGAARTRPRRVPGRGPGASRTRPRRGQDAAQARPGRGPGVSRPRPSAPQRAARPRPSALPGRGPARLAAQVRDLIPNGPEGFRNPRKACRRARKSSGSQGR